MLDLLVNVILKFLLTKKILCGETVKKMEAIIYYTKLFGYIVIDRKIQISS
jgi:hypothetical protein